MIVARAHPIRHRLFSASAKAMCMHAYLAEFGSFSGPARDPRGWSLTVVSPRIILFPVNTLPNLPFDHSLIIASVVERARSKSNYSPLPVHLCPPEFTIPELHAADEVILGEAINMANFRRKLMDLDLLEPNQSPLPRHQMAAPCQCPRLRGIRGVALKRDGKSASLAAHGAVSECAQTQARGRRGQCAHSRRNASRLHPHGREHTPEASWRSA